MPAIRKHTSSTASSSKSNKPYSRNTVSLANHGRNRGSKKSYSNGSMKPIFNDCFMSLAGDFASSRDSPNLTYEKIIKWIQGHGGIYTRDITEETTHLIVTIEEYKKRSGIVKKAIAMGKRCRIVVYDWIEDCLIAKTGKKKKLATKGYELSRVIKRLHHTEEQKMKYRLSFENGVKVGRDLVDNRLNHIYTDPTGFEYKVVLSRVTLHGKHKIQKYTIYLFESHAIPRTYMSGAKLSIPHVKAVHWDEECHPKVFADAYNDFKKMFAKKTNVEWDDRFEPLPEGHGEGWFRFLKPPVGRPVGALPSWRKAPTWEEEREVDSCGESVKGEGEGEGEGEDEVDEGEGEGPANVDVAGGGDVRAEKKDDIQNGKKKEIEVINLVDGEYDSDSNVEDADSGDEEEEEEEEDESEDDDGEEDGGQGKKSQGRLLLPSPPKSPRKVEVIEISDSSEGDGDESE